MDELLCEDEQAQVFEFRICAPWRRSDERVHGVEVPVRRSHETIASRAIARTSPVING